MVVGPSQMHKVFEVFTKDIWKFLFPIFCMIGKISYLEQWESTLIGHDIIHIKYKLAEADHSRPYLFLLAYDLLDSHTYTYHAMIGCDLA